MGNLFSIGDTQRSNRRENGSLIELTEHLHDLLVKNIHFQIPESEVCDIREAVEDMVERILEECERDDHRMVVEEVLKVGSSYDGTKICRPDEFDFLVVLDQQRFAGGRNLEVRKNDVGLFEFVDGDDYMSGTYDFTMSIICVLRRLREEHFIIAKTTGTLSISQYENNKLYKVNGPATTITLSWNGSQQMEISVDIVPAIRMSNVLNYVSGSDVKYMHDKLYETLLETGTILLIRKRVDLQMTFTETEAAVIKEQFSQKHRDVLKLLKYYMLSCPVCIRLTSYVLKLCVIHHHYRCMHGDGESIAYCLVEALHVQSIPGLVCLENGDVSIPRLLQKHDIYTYLYSGVKELSDARLKIHMDITENNIPYSFADCKRSQLNVLTADLYTHLISLNFIMCNLYNYMARLRTQDRKNDVELD